MIAMAAGLLPTSAEARPTAGPLICDEYSEAALCNGRLPTCATCHLSTDPPSWNDYGSDVRGALDADFDEGLASAMRAIDALDSDEDGVTNLDELLLGSSPGEPDACASTPPETSYSGFDYDRARRRIATLYCGSSATADEMDAFFEGSPDETTLKKRMHEALEACLASKSWRDRGLPELAHALIRPVAPVGHETNIGIDLGDYKYDYRLFSYVLTGDRDARELLTADYHIDESFEKVTGIITTATATSGTQALEPSRRAGMITTEWFLLINTMFSDLPRTTAAQAYRGYLGMDVSLQEGIFPIEGEPLDIDDKGVGEAACAQCHSTLDPLAYSFAYYEGIAGQKTGTYDAERPSRLFDDWDENRSYLFGEAVEDLPDWARRAADSDAFRRNLATMFFRHALGREPGVLDEDGLTAAAASMVENGHSANKLIHVLVELPAFGGLQ